MGLFSSITNAIKPVANFMSEVAPIAPLVSGITGLVSTAAQNKQAQAAVRQAQEYQTGMSNTSYQRAMADMRAAGLNPILAYQQGGASTPSGFTYQPQNMSSVATQSMLNTAQSAKIGTEIEYLIPATVDKLVADSANALSAMGLNKQNERKSFIETQIAYLQLGLKDLDARGYAKLSELLGVPVGPQLTGEALRAATVSLDKLLDSVRIISQFLPGKKKPK